MSTIPTPASLPTPVVDDGTEFRAATVRVREGGLQELLDCMGPDGFYRVSDVRVQLIDGELYLSFCSNIKKEERHVFLGIDVFIPVKDLKQPVIPDDPAPAETVP